LLLNLHPRLTPQPTLQAARCWRPRPRWALHHDLAFDQTDDIASRSGRCPFDANRRALASEKDLAPPSVSHTYLSQSINSPKLIENPFLILVQKYRYIIVGSIDRLHDLDAVNAHPDTQLTVDRDATSR
jgi:hypothetical protein